MVQGLLTDTYLEAHVCYNSLLFHSNYFLTICLSLICSSNKCCKLLYTKTNALHFSLQLPLGHLLRDDQINQVKMSIREYVHPSVRPYVHNETQCSHKPNSGTVFVKVDEIFMMI